MKLHISLTFFLCLMVTKMIFTGFAEGTLVKVPGGYSPIEELEIGDLVYAVKEDGNCSVSRVKFLSSFTGRKHVVLEVDGEQIVVATGQKFYHPELHEWRKAKHLTRHMALLSGVDKIRYVASSTKTKEATLFFDIRLEDVHTFCVTEHDIVVHNFPACMVGFSIAWGCEKVVFETVYFGICIAGWWVANTFLMKGKDQKSDVGLAIFDRKAT